MIKALKELWEAIYRGLTYDVEGYSRQEILNQSMQDWSDANAAEYELVLGIVGCIIGGVFALVIIVIIELLFF